MGESPLALYGRSSNIVARGDAVNTVLPLVHVAHFQWSFMARMWTSQSPLHPSPTVWALVRLHRQAMATRRTGPPCRFLRRVLPLYQSFAASATELVTFRILCSAILTLHGPLSIVNHLSSIWSFLAGGCLGCAKTSRPTRQLSCAGLRTGNQCLSTHTMLFKSAPYHIVSSLPDGTD